MIEDTRDILNIVLAFSVIWVAIFLSWFLYYLGKTMKNVNQIIEETQDKFRSVFSAIDFIRDKIGILASAAAYLVQSFIGRDREDTGKKNKKAKK